MRTDDLYHTQLVNKSLNEMANEREVLVIRENAIQHELDVFDARRGALNIALEAGFNRKQAYYIVTAMTELGNNIVFHSVGGSLILQAIYGGASNRHERSIGGLEIIATDMGPGIIDIEKAMQEGYSTSNSLGCGLSGAQRLMDEFDIHSSKNGTTVRAILWIE